MDYAVLEELGRGGFGVVHKVADATGKLFARKTFSPASYIPTTAHDRLRKRFRREALIQQHLGGHEILPILDYSLDIGNPWFVMPLAGNTYDKQIVIEKASGVVGVDAIADVLNGLDYLHRLSFVHRDLNPRNILLHEGTWKLSDLGAVLPPTGVTVTLTDGTAIYTEQYCSPEQRNDFHSAQSAADIYSFGCILHDIFGTPPRTPYGRQTADGEIGIIIEKCTDPNPKKRPSIGVLRTLVIEALLEAGGQCKVVDEKAEQWLSQINRMAEWGDADYDNFARFFAQLSIEERTMGHEHAWVGSLSTPFLTRVPATALVQISQRNDCIAEAVIAKYCEWARSTPFLFSYSDLVCSRLTAIFDNGSPTHRAMAFAALVRLASGHNRWHVMRELLERCGKSTLSDEMSLRLKIEIKAEGLEAEFRQCVETIKWDESRIAPEIAKVLR